MKESVQERLGTSRDTRTCLFARTAERVDDELLVPVGHSSLLGRICPFEDALVPLLEPAHDLAVDALRRLSMIQRTTREMNWVDGCIRIDGSPALTSSPSKSENFFGRYLSTHMTLDGPALPLSASSALRCSSSNRA